MEDFSFCPSCNKLVSSCHCTTPTIKKKSNEELKENLGLQIDFLTRKVQEKVPVLVCLRNICEQIEYEELPQNWVLEELSTMYEDNRSLYTEDMDKLRELILVEHYLNGYTPRCDVNMNKVHNIMGA